MRNREARLRLAATCRTLAAQLEKDEDSGIAGAQQSAAAQQAVDGMAKVVAGIGFMSPQSIEGQASMVHATWWAAVSAGLDLAGIQDVIKAFLAKIERSPIEPTPKAAQTIAELASFAAVTAPRS